jgi:hypothetical protein
MALSFFLSLSVPYLPKIVLSTQLGTLRYLKVPSTLYDQKLKMLCFIPL